MKEGGEGKTEEEIVGWYHQPLKGHKFELTPGDGEGQETLAWCSLGVQKKLDMTVFERQ